jgi:hypothetical protein
MLPKGHVRGSILAIPKHSHHPGVVHRLPNIELTVLESVCDLCDISPGRLGKALEDVGVMMSKVVFDRPKVGY